MINIKNIIIVILLITISTTTVLADNVDAEKWSKDAQEDAFSVFENTEWSKYMEYINISVNSERKADIQNVSRIIQDKYSEPVKEALAKCSYKSRYPKEEYEALFIAMIATMEAGYSLEKGEVKDKRGFVNFYSKHYFGDTFEVGEKGDAEALGKALDNLMKRFFEAEQIKIEGKTPVNIYQMNSSLKRAIESVMLDSGFMTYKVEDIEDDYTVLKAQEYAVGKTYEGNRLIGFADNVSYRYICYGPSIANGEQIYFNQGDPEWNQGGSEYIRSEGCSGTAMAMILRYFSGDSNMNPHTFYTTYRAKYGWPYSGTALISTAAMINDLADFNCKQTMVNTSSWSDVDRCLENGGAVLYNCEGGSGRGHYVAILGKKNDRYLIADPGNADRAYNGFTAGGSISGRNVSGYTVEELQNDPYWKLRATNFTCYEPFY